MDKPAPLHPGVKMLWWTVALGITVPATAALSIAGRMFRWPLLSWFGPSVVLLALAAVLPPFIYRRWRYQIRDEDVYTSRGALFYIQTLVPFDRIQFVETRQGPLDRLFKLAQVIVYTAAGKAGRIPGLSISEAESLANTFPELQEPKASNAAPIQGARLSPAAIPIWFLYESPGLAAGLVPLFFLGPSALVAIAIGGISLVVPVIRYLRFTYALDGDSLVVEGGLLSRWRRVIPRTKIQSVDMVRKLRHKAFGVVELRIEVVGGSKTEAQLVALEQSEADRIRAWASGEDATGATPAVSASDSPPLARMAVPDLLIAGATGGRIAVFAILIGYAQQVTGEQVFENLSSRVFDRAASEGAPFLLLIAATLLLVVALTLALSLIATVLTYWNFTLERVGNRLVITRGLLESRRATLPLAKIQALEINENIIRRIFGMASITAVVAGYSGSKEESIETSMVLPIAKHKTAISLVTEILGLSPGASVTRLMAAPTKALGLRLVRSLLGGAILSALMLFAAWGIDQVDPDFPTQLLRAAAVLPMPLFALVAYGAWRSLGHLVNRECAIVRSGLAVRTTSVVPRTNIQHLSLRRSILQAPWQLATLNLHIPKSIKQAEDIDSTEARRLLTELSAPVVNLD